MERRPELDVNYNNRLRNKAYRRAPSCCAVRCITLYSKHLARVQRTGMSRTLRGSLTNCAPGRVVASGYISCLSELMEPCIDGSRTSGWGCIDAASLSTY